MLGIQNTPGLGADYIVKFKSTVEPFILSGGSNVIRDAVVRGQFAIGFSGRGDFFDGLPKGAPLAWVVPKEGLAWTPSSIALINGAPNAERRQGVHHLALRGGADAALDRAGPADTASRRQGADPGDEPCRGDN